jgi:predicted phage terminase large subunit-like protein
VKEKHLYLIHVYRKRVGYPELKRAVPEQADAFGPQTILIEDKASGTQLIQEFVEEGMHAIKKYEPTIEKIMRMNSVTGTIENGFVHLPDKAAWLGEYLHELTTFPNGKYDDQADSTSQALDWIKSCSMNETLGWIDYLKHYSEPTPLSVRISAIPQSMPCTNCSGVMSQLIPSGLRCMQCGAQWISPCAVSVPSFSRVDVLRRAVFR